MSNISSRPSSRARARDASTRCDGRRVHSFEPSPARSPPSIFGRMNARARGDAIAGTTRATKGKRARVVVVVSVGRAVVVVVITREGASIIDRSIDRSFVVVVALEVAHTATRAPAVRKKTTAPTKRAIERASTPFASRIAGLGELNSRSKKAATDMT